MPTKSGPSFLQQIMADSGRLLAARKIISADEAKSSGQVVDGIIIESDIWDEVKGEWQWGTF
jgi:hypothetical protein